MTIRVTGGSQPLFVEHLRKTVNDTLKVTVYPEGGGFSKTGLLSKIKLTSKRDYPEIKFEIVNINKHSCTLGCEFV